MAKVLKGDRIEVRGVKEFEERMKRISEDGRLRVSEQIHLAANRVRSNAKGLAPRRTGALANSITVADSETAFREEQAGLTPGGITAVVGTSLFYARWVHFGRKDPPMPANPFLYNAQREEQKVLARDINRVLKQECAKK